MDYNTASKTLAFSKVKFTKAFVNDHINKDWPIDKIGYYSTTSNEIPSITAKSIERGKVDDIYKIFSIEKVILNDVPQYKINWCPFREGDTYIYYEPTFTDGSIFKNKTIVDDLIEMYLTDKQKNRNKFATLYRCMSQPPSRSHKRSRNGTSPCNHGDLGIEGLMKELKREKEEHDLLRKQEQVAQEEHDLLMKQEKVAHTVTRGNSEHDESKNSTDQNEMCGISDLTAAKIISSFANNNDTYAK
jgi:hypothetical protein